MMNLDKVISKGITIVALTMSVASIVVGIYCMAWHAIALGILVGWLGIVTHNDDSN